MANTIKKYKITQLQDDDSLLELHPETDADIVKVATGTGKYPGTATDVQAALKETYELAQTGGVTGVKGNAETTYRTGDVNLTPANIGAQPAFTDGTATIVTTASDVVTIKTSVTQSGGKIAAGSSSVTLAKVAKTGAYNDLTGKPTLGTAAACNTGTSSGNVPVLDSNGKLSTSIIPAVAITDTFTAANQAAMLALSAQKGDICIRTDISTTFILAEDGASTLSHWKQLATPTDAVTSVNGMTGAVIIDGDIITCVNTGYDTLDGNTVDVAIGKVNGWLNGALTRIGTAETDISNLKDGTVSAGKADAPSVTTPDAIVYTASSSADAPGSFKTQALAQGIVIANAASETNRFSFATTLATSYIPNLDASKITSGTFADARIASAATWNAKYTKPSTGIPSSDLASISGLDTTKAYSAYKVNAKGQVVAQGAMIEVGTTGQTAPSASLAVGGLFFQEI